MVSVRHHICPVGVLAASGICELGVLHSLKKAEGLVWGKKYIHNCSYHILGLNILKVLIDKWLLLTCFTVQVINSTSSQLVPRADKALISSDGITS